MAKSSKHIQGKKQKKGSYLPYFMAILFNRIISVAFSGTHNKLMKENTVR